MKLMIAFVVFVLAILFVMLSSAPGFMPSWLSMEKVPDYVKAIIIIVLIVGASIFLQACISDNEKQID